PSRRARVRSPAGAPVGAQRRDRKRGKVMSRLLLKAICLLALVVAVPEARATTIRRMTHEEMAQRAELIVVGRGMESRSVWVGRMLVTRVTVAVDEILK